MTRIDGRKVNELRPVHIITDYLKHPEGSAFIQQGDTKIICAASIEDRVPPFMRGTGKGWITAEYSMLPRATEQRNIRESSKGKISGRTMEIQRLIGRTLRSVVDLNRIGEKTIWIDCDVIQADGGTRTASITAAFVSLALALNKQYEEQNMEKFPVTDFLAATSVGIMKEYGTILDLNYSEDSKAEVDMNVVMTGSDRFVEIQGTGEESTFSHGQLLELLDLAKEGIHQLIHIQREVLGPIADKIGR